MTEPDTTAAAATEPATPVRNTTLRRRLLHLLLAPLLLLLVAGMLLDYRSAVTITSDAYDQALLNTAIAIAARLNDREDVDAEDVDLPALAQNMLHAGQHHQVLFAVCDAQGKLLSGSAGLLQVDTSTDNSENNAPAETSGSATFGFIALEKHTLRYVRHRSHSERLGDISTVVAESTEERDDAARHMMFNTLWPNLLQISVALALVYVGVRRGLQPLAELGARIAARGEQDFSPISGHNIPGEAQPLVRAMNQLMGNLHDAETAQRAFIANAAHQLRLPLTAMQTQLELAEPAFPPQERQRLNELQASTGKLVHLVSQLLTLARTAPEAVDTAQMETVPLASVVESATGKCVDAALARQIDLGCEIEPVDVQGWRWLLAEMLSNLIDNALRHARSRITVRCGRDNHGNPFLAVEDDGPGIPQALRERVFDRFFRMSADHTTGTGLGLAIVKEVALRHQAQITVQAPAGGEGVAFVISFPAAQPSPQLRASVGSGR